MRLFIVPLLVLATAIPAMAHHHDDWEGHRQREWEYRQRWEHRRGEWESHHGPRVVEYRSLEPSWEHGRRERRYEEEREVVVLPPPPPPPPIPHHRGVRVWFGF